MDSLRGSLFLLILLTVKAFQDSGMFQVEIGLPDELLDMLKQGSLEPKPDVRQKAPEDPVVSFPLARPTMDNILAICHYSNLRPRYNEDMLPRSGFGYLHRWASAVNQLESWFTVCCSNGTQDEELTLCCAQQAWKRSLSAFCEEEFTIKTRPYHCCKKSEPAKWDCFEKEAPDPLYQSSYYKVPSTIKAFDFNSSSCQKTSVSDITPRPETMTEPPTPSWIEQKMVIPEMFREEKGLSGHHMSRSHFMEPSIPFPLARPTTTNILAICQYSNQRPRYYKEMLPRSGFGHLYRQASAINQLESWYTLCCSNDTKDDELTLCCAQQAWEKSLSDFCEEEFRIKTNHYHCCKVKGPAKWDCFEKEASDMSYQPSAREVPTILPPTLQGLGFDPNNCQKTSTSEVHSSALTSSELIKTPHIIFPPGRPNSNNIALICALHKHRPRYVTSCLPRTGYDWLARQIKAINGLEKSFGKCCKERKDTQACAEGKWKKMVDRFCKDEKKVQVNQFECCKKQSREEQYVCFSTAAPNPDYVSLIDVDLEPSSRLNVFCDAYTALQKMKHLPFTVDEMAEKCCILVEDKRSACLQLQLDNILDDACKADNPALAQIKKNCCKKTTEGRSKCITKLLLNDITKAKRVNNNHRICLFFSQKPID